MQKEKGIDYGGPITLFIVDKQRPSGMTCVRRPAYAQRPALSADSPSRPDPCSGRFRARFFGFLSALALVVGALSLPAPAQAQTKLVANDVHRQAGANGVEVNNNMVAQGFTTGSNPLGYALTSISVRAGTWAASPDQIRAELWSNNTQGVNGSIPGTKLVELIVPSVINQFQYHTYEAPAGTRLDADTTYHLVIRKTAAIGSSVITTTSSGTEDADSAPGWSIANKARLRGYGAGAVWNLPGQRVFWFRVYGTILSNPTGPVTLSAWPNPAVERSFVNVIARVPAGTSFPENLNFNISEGIGVAWWDQDGSFTLPAEIPTKFDLSPSHDATEVSAWLTIGPNAGGETIEINAYSGRSVLNGEPLIIRILDSEGGTPPGDTPGGDPGGDLGGDPGGVPPGDDPGDEPGGDPGAVPPDDPGTTGTGLSAPERAQRSFQENIGDTPTPEAVDIGAPVTATGTSPGESLQYTLEGSDRETFTINAHTGQLRTRPGVLYDYEQRTTYAVVVRASTATASVTTGVTITLIDMPEVPLAPPAPQVRQQAGDDTSLAVTWTAPPNAGRPAISGYGVRYRAGPSGAWKPVAVPPGAIRTQLTGLAPDTRYQVQVRAMNANGYGPWSGAGQGSPGMAADAPEVEAWLVRFGRTVSDQVLEAAGDRFTASRPGFTARLAGLDFKALRIREPAWQDEPAVPDTGRSLSWAEAVRGTSFSYTATTGAGGQASFWGRGALTRFDGEDGTLRLDGEAVTGLLGADLVRGSLRAGLILSHSDGDGEYRSPTGSGDLDSDLTGLYPWMHRALGERLSVWGLAGYGEGEIRFKPDDGVALTADTDLRMAAAGLRSMLQAGETGSRPELTLTSDGLYVRTESDAVGQALAGTSAELTRLRLALEGTWHVPLASGAHLHPSVQAGVRHDGGDAESGFGADLATGVAWTDLQRGLTAFVQARGLLTHEDSGFQERGLAASLAWDPHPASAAGWSMTLRQTLGAPATGGMDTLLRPDAVSLPASNDEQENARQRRHFEATLGYGVLHAHGQLVGTPRATLALSDAAREVRLGWHLGLARKDALHFGLELQGTRQEPLDDDRTPEHRLQLHLGAHW